MKNFIFKSPDSDLQKMFTILNQNILYITHMEDKILKIVTSLKVDESTQTQVDDYYESKEPEEDKEPD